MPAQAPRWPAAVALGASALGLAFAASSSLDYARHLDRQVHDIHCSFVPGMGAEHNADNACRVAMYSPFAALFRDDFWGGIPISLFAVGAFVFFGAFALYLLLAGESAPRKSALFLALAGTTPFLVSILMGTISAIRLGQFCKTCVGIYAASTILAFASIAHYVLSRRGDVAAAEAQMRGRGRVAPTAVDGREPLRPEGSLLLLPLWFLALGAAAIAPAALYASAVPSYANYVGKCGKLARTAAQEKPEIRNALIHITPAGARQQATLLVDPLCPTCKAFHQRLVAEGIFEQLDTTLVLFPLDNECNWNLDRPVHPGACLVSRAILCSEHRALQVLEWAYDNQEKLLAGARASAGMNNVRHMIRQRWQGLDVCIDSKETKQKLERTLHFAVNNNLPVSTPQMFLGSTRVCDEDTDMGLAYTLRKLAPSLRSR